MKDAIEVMTLTPVRYGKLHLQSRAAYIYSSNSWCKHRQKVAAKSTLDAAWGCFIGLAP